MVRRNIGWVLFAVGWLASAHFGQAFTETSATFEPRQFAHLLSAPPFALGQSPVATPTANQPAGEYRIGPHDELAIAVLQAPELNTKARVSPQGDVSLPLVGTIRATGLSALELERAIEERLREKYIREPDVTVQVTEIQSRPLSVVGAVNKPGVFQARGAQSLLEVLSLAGGLADTAGDAIMIMRSSATGGQSGGLDFPTDVPDANVISPTVLEIRLKALLESRDPRLNVVVYPGDVVNVQTAATVYVVGSVRKPGAFAMRGNDQLTVLRALALGEGVLPMAAQSDALIVRTSADGSRVEIPVNLSHILQGKSADLPLQAQDVLFVPQSGTKAVARLALDALTRIVTFRAWVP